MGAFIFSTAAFLLGVGVTLVTVAVAHYRKGLAIAKVFVPLPETMTDQFVRTVIADLELLAQQAKNRGDPPYAALLYESDLDCTSFALVGNGATATIRSQEGDLLHAETTLLWNNQQALFANMNPHGAPSKAFHLFVNAPSCTMCAASTIKANIAHGYYRFTAARGDVVMTPPISIEEVVYRTNETIEQNPGKYSGKPRIKLHWLAICDNCNCVIRDPGRIAAIDKRILCHKCK